LRTEEGEQYGPVPKAEMDTWLAEGRIDETCRVLQEGWTEWKPAADVYPELCVAAGSAPDATADRGASMAGPVEPIPVEPEVDPFAAPQTSTASLAADESGPPRSVTPGARWALAQTRPWILFLSILILLVGTVGAIAGFVMLSIAMVAGDIGTVLAALTVMTVLALYLAAGYFLFTCGAKIAAFLRTDAPEDLEAALAAQRSFWRLTGIVTAAVIGVCLFAFLAMVVIGAVAG
jgi:hypothetical protein